MTGPLHVAYQNLSRLKLLPRNTRNRRKLYVQFAMDRQLCVAEWNWRLIIYLYSIDNSNDQLRFFNTMEWEPSK